MRAAQADLLAVTHKVRPRRQSPPKASSAHVLLVGRRESDAGDVAPEVLVDAGNDMFARIEELLQELDAHLSEENIRLNDLFRRCDPKGTGFVAHNVAARKLFRTCR